MKLSMMIATLAMCFAVSPVHLAGGLASERSGDPTKGRKIFVKYCSGCHGAKGEGDGYRLLGPSAANLASPSIQERSNEELLRTIHEGKPNMPVWKYRFSSEDSQDVLAYIRSLTNDRKP
jgi:mono/diheme cytochrome c family protein